MDDQAVTAGRLTAELVAHQPRLTPMSRGWGRGWALTGCSCGWTLDGVTSMDRHQADALLPVVRQIAAAELRAAADALTDRARTWVLNELRDRADHLDGQAT